MNQILIATALALMLTQAACQDEGRCGPSSGTVERVIDGDTIKLTSGETIRYLMIDTPEISGAGECYGDEATQANTDLVAGREVRLDYDVECTDRYDRLLAYVSIGDREINSLMVERGFACVLHIPPNGADRKLEFEGLESLARQQNKGLWAICKDAPC